jgi:putative transposase
MARLPRLCLPGLPHLMRQRGHSDAAVFLDDADRQTYHAALREAAALQRLPVHAYALLRSEVRLLITPDQPDSLGRLLQSVGRRYGAAFNRRHGRSGGLWEGRFRATVVEPGLELLGAMGWVEGAPHRAGLVVRAQDWPWSSARHHLGQAREPWLVDPAEYWALGNTPFDRGRISCASGRLHRPAGIAPSERPAAAGGRLTLQRAQARCRALAWCGPANLGTHAVRQR